MKRCLFFLLISSGLYAATYIDVVHLKDGSQHRGIIVENIPNKSVKLEMADGTIKRFTYEQIVKFTRSKDLTGVHSHEGFYFRVSGRLGLGMVEQEVTSPFFVSASGETIATYDGIGAGLGFDIGGAPFQNFILFATFHYVWLPSPSTTIGNVTTETSDFQINIVNLGGGICYYFMPSNIFVSGSVNLSYNTFATSGSTLNTDAGYGATLSVGKEWWASEQWGVGLAIWGHYSRAAGLNDTGFSFATADEVKFTNIAFGAAVTGTYN